MRAMSRAVFIYAVAFSLLSPGYLYHKGHHGGKGQTLGTSAGWSILGVGRALPTVANFGELLRVARGSPRA